MLQPILAIDIFSLLHDEISDNCASLRPNKISAATPPLISTNVAIKTNMYIINIKNKHRRNHHKCCKASQASARPIRPAIAAI